MNLSGNRESSESPLSCKRELTGYVSKYKIVHVARTEYRGSNAGRNEATTYRKDDDEITTTITTTTKTSENEASKITLCRNETPEITAFVKNEVGERAAFSEDEAGEPTLLESEELTGSASNDNIVHVARADEHVHNPGGIAATTYKKADEITTTCENVASEKTFCKHEAPEITASPKNAVAEITASSEDEADETTMCESEELTGSVSKYKIVHVARTDYQENNAGGNEATTCRKEADEITTSENEASEITFSKNESPEITAFPKNEVVETTFFEDEAGEATEILITICEEQAKSDVYLSDNDGSPLKKKMKIKCPACEQYCRSRSNIRRHIKRFHKGDGLHGLLEQVSPELSISCSACEQKFSHTKYLKLHLGKTHGILFDEQKHSFTNDEEFLEWKNEIEKSTDSVYIKQTGKVQRNDNKSYRYFRCNRTGNYIPKVSPTQRKRKMKSYGTVKLNSHCTSTMRVIYEETGELNVLFCATHYGHDGFNECRITMLENPYYNPRTMRKMEASKMIAPRNVSGKCIRESVPTSLPDEPVVSIIVEAYDDSSTAAFDEHDTVVEGDAKDEFNNSDCQEATKRKLLSNLQQLMCVIEKCQSGDILEMIANDVGDLVGKFEGIVDEQY